MLTEPVDKDLLDNCGPLDWRIPRDTDPLTHKKKVTAIPPKDRTPRPAPAPLPKPGKLQERYLINVTVGEDWAKCHELPAANTTVVGAYEFEKSIIVQCITPDAYAGFDVAWGLTTDWCYVNGRDIFESLDGDCKTSFRNKNESKKLTTYCRCMDAFVREIRTTMRFSRYHAGFC
jgi:hypothetical protein